MDLEAKPLQYFAAVARETSFSRAAARMALRLALPEGPIS